MKKYTLVLISMTLLLATLACSLPALTQKTDSTPELPAAGEVTPSAGMAVYNANGVAITLPDTYILQDLSNLPMENEVLQQLYQQYADDVVMVAYNANPAADAQNGLLVFRNETYAAVPLGLISPVLTPLFGDTVTVLDQEQFSLNGRDTLRLQTTAGANDAAMNLVIYVFKDAGQLWLLGFLTSQSLMAAQLPVFDAAVASFTVLSVE